MDIYTHTGCVRDSMCRVEGKYCDWGCDREKEGKDLFSEKNWFDHFTLSYIQALIHTHTHHSHTSLGRHKGPRLNLASRKLKFWLLGQESRWKQHPSKLVAFLSVSSPINPSFPHEFPPSAFFFLLSLHAIPGITAPFPDGGWSGRRLTLLPTYGASSLGRETLNPPTMILS